MSKVITYFIVLGVLAFGETKETELSVGEVVALDGYASGYGVAKVVGIRPAKNGGEVDLFDLEVVYPGPRSFKSATLIARRGHVSRTVKKLSNNLTQGNIVMYQQSQGELATKGSRLAEGVPARVEFVFENGKTLIRTGYSLSSYFLHDGSSLTLAPLTSKNKFEKIRKNNVGSVGLHRASAIANCWLVIQKAGGERRI